MAVRRPPHQPERAQPIRLAIWSQHGVFRAGLRLLVEAKTGTAIVSEVDSVASLLALDPTRTPEVILLDGDACGTVSDSDWATLQVQVPAARVLLLTSGDVRDVASVMLRSPRLGVISKADAPEALLTAVCTPRAGEPATDGPVREALRGERRLAAYGPGLLDKRVLLVLQTVAQDLRRSDSIEMLASRVGIGGSRLRHLLRASIGMSLSQFRMEQRLDATARLLTGGHTRVSEVAYQVGFSDVTYFNKAFRKRFSVSPTAYRQARVERHSDAMVHSAPRRLEMWSLSPSAPTDRRR